MGEKKHNSIKNVEKRSRLGVKSETWVSGASGFSVGADMLICSRSQLQTGIDKNTHHYKNIVSQS